MTATDPAFPITGRVSRTEVRIRPSHVRGGGVAKLTAVGAALLDAAFDDLVEANGGWIPGMALMVRANVIDHWEPARLGERLTIDVACGGLARHWLEHRTRGTGSRGAHVEISTSWVLVDVAAGRPARLPEAVVTAYADAADRRPRAVPRIPPPPPDADRRPWSVRADDLDGNDHVNNAAYLSAVAEALETCPVPVPHRVEILYRNELSWPSRPNLVTAVRSGDDSGAGPVEAWLVGDTGVHAAMRITALDPADRPDRPDRPAQPTR